MEAIKSIAAFTPAAMAVGAAIFLALKEKSYDGFLPAAFFLMLLAASVANHG